MKTLLRIDCSLRRLNSFSRRVGDYFVQNWQSKYPEHQIMVRDLEDKPVPHLTQHTIDTFFDPKGKAHPISDDLIHELSISDDILITCLMYNFGIPSSLKAYFDHIIRRNKTFVNENGHKGLLNGKRAYLITAMGGSKLDAINSMEIHLTNSLTFIGITDLTIFRLMEMADPTNAHLALRDVYTKINLQFNHYEQVISN